VRWATTIVALATLAADASPALADEYEWQIGVAPGATIAWRDGHADLGISARTIAQYGLLDSLALEVSGSCDYVPGVSSKQSDSEYLTSPIFHDMQRCTLVPALVGRFGRRWVISISGGLGYRYERHTNREGFSRSGEFVPVEPVETRHLMIIESGIGMELRVREVFGVGGILRAAVPINSSSREANVDLVFAVLLSFFGYGG